MINFKSHGRHIKTNLFIISALLMLVWNIPNSIACSNVSVSGKNFTAVARTMDLETNTGNIFALGLPGEKNISDLNLNTQQKLSALHWINRYAFIGQTAMHSTIVLDGTNTAGLYVGYLELPDITKYPQYNDLDKRPALGIVDIANYLLGTAKTVKAALKELKATQIIKNTFPFFPENGKGMFGIFPLHIVIRDNSGDSAVIEFIHGKALVYHPAGNVLTNSPSLAWQLKNAAKYNYVTTENTNKKTAGMYMNGSGFHGIPGNWSPPSRFARATQVLKNAPKTHNVNQAMNLALIVLQSVRVPLGTNPSPTIWETVSDLKNHIYYFKLLYNIIKPNVYRVSGNSPLKPWEAYHVDRIAKYKKLPRGWLRATIKPTPKKDIKIINNIGMQPTTGKKPLQIKFVK